MDFGCRRIDSKDLIKCTFGLNKTELDLFLFLSKSNKCETVSTVSKTLDLDRTTIQKSLKKLLEREIIERRQNNLDNGGYVFLYCIKKKPEIKDRMQKIIDDWHHSASSEISHIFNDAGVKVHAVGAANA
jgi:predicted transcriptional regulator